MSNYTRDSPSIHPRSFGRDKCKLNIYTLLASCTTIMAYKSTESSQDLSVFQRVKAPSEQDGKKTRSFSFVQIENAYLNVYPAFEFKVAAKKPSSVVVHNQVTSNFAAARADQQFDIQSPCSVVSWHLRWYVSGVLKTWPSYSNKSWHIKTLTIGATKSLREGCCIKILNTSATPHNLHPYHDSCPYQSP